MNYYEHLGVSNTASPDEIKTAFRNKAKSLHPDQGGNEKDFQKLNEAYDTLKDPNKKSHYDHLQRNGGNIHINVNGKNHDIFKDVFNDINNSFGGGFTQTRSYTRQSRNKDLSITVECTLEDTLIQQQKSISVRHLTGNREIVQVTIPRGMKNKDKIRYTGLGDKSFPELTTGDLYVNINILKHNKFTVDGSNLYCTETVDCFDAILGTIISLKNLEGTTLNVTIPSGTQHGTMFSLKRQGAYDKNSDARGNIVVIVAVKIPEMLTNEQLTVIKSWRKRND